VKKCAEATGDEGAKAAGMFLDSLVSGVETVDLASLSRKVASNDLFAFAYYDDAGSLMTERQLIREYWKKLRAKDGEDVDAKTKKALQCLVTGQVFYDTELFQQIKKLPGYEGGVSLVCFNKEAFESYGWSSNNNAPVSRAAAEAAATALNRLIDPKPHDPNNTDLLLIRQNIKLSADTVLCYWSKEDSDLSKTLRELLEGDPQNVEKLIRSPWRGVKPLFWEDNIPFYAMTLTGTKGRVIIRDWFESTIPEIQENLREYFQDIFIVRSNKKKDRDASQPMAIGALLESLAMPSKDRSKTIPGHMTASFARSALSGEIFPEDALHRAVERYRCEIGKANDEKDGWITRERNDARCAVIKAVLNRKHRKIAGKNEKYTEVNPEMDPNNRNPGYLLGRLMAVMERLQVEALQSEREERGEEDEVKIVTQTVNTTIVDRFFKGASATPNAIFPKLLINSAHHTSKLAGKRNKEGLAILYKNYIGEILSSFGSSLHTHQLHKNANNAFPSFLGPDDQGMYVVGYHHMRRWLWMSKEERLKWENGYSDVPRAYVTKQDDEKLNKEGK
jgi:CRISPR-associated protein Csd1